MIGEMRVELADEETPVLAYGVICGAVPVGRIGALVVELCIGAVPVGKIGYLVVGAVPVGKMGLTTTDELPVPVGRMEVVFQ